MLLDHSFGHFTAVTLPRVTNCNLFQINYCSIVHFSPMLCVELDTLSPFIGIDFKVSIPEVNGL